MKKIFEVAKSVIEDESGQELIEYALIAALVALASVTVLKNLTTQINGAYNSIIDSLKSATTTTTAPSGS